VRLIYHARSLCKIWWLFRAYELLEYLWPNYWNVKVEYPQSYFRDFLYADIHMDIGIHRRKSKYGIHCHKTIQCKRTWSRKLIMQTVRVFVCATFHHSSATIHPIFFSSAPFILHSSHVIENMNKELPGSLLSEKLWPRIQEAGSSHNSQSNIEHTRSLLIEDGRCCR
jgi:hypothetical protein